MPPVAHVLSMPIGGWPCHPSCQAGLLASATCFAVPCLPFLPAGLLGWHQHNVDQSCFTRTRFSIREGLMLESEWGCTEREGPRLAPPTQEGGAGRGGGTGEALVPGLVCWAGQLGASQPAVGCFAQRKGRGRSCGAGARMHVWADGQQCPKEGRQQQGRAGGCTGARTHAAAGGRAGAGHLRVLIGRAGANETEVCGLEGGAQSPPPPLQLCRQACRQSRMQGGCSCRGGGCV